MELSVRARGKEVEARVRRSSMKAKLADMRIFGPGAVTQEA
jgi:hypothetical protein